MKYSALFSVSLLLLCGCASYSWKSNVPVKKRTISVPVFRNESNILRLGAVCSTQLSRELQREGTFKLDKNPSYEIQGVVKTASTSSLNITRANVTRLKEHVITAEAQVSLIDKISNSIVIDAKVYKARTTVLAGHDIITAERDASGRLAEDLSRQIVDDIIDYTSQQEESK